MTAYKSRFRAPLFFRKKAGILLLALCAAMGGAAAGDATQNETYRQAMRDAEREAREYDAQSRDGSGWTLSAVLSIAALAAAVGLTAWLARRLRRHGWNAASTGEMRVVDRLPLGRQSTLFIVEVGGKRYWLAEHSHGIALLGECSEKVTPPPTS